MTLFAVTTYNAYATICGQRHELCITVRNLGNCDTEALEGMAAHTIATWARVYRAVADGTWIIPSFNGKEWISACKQKNVENLVDIDPHVTVWNKDRQTGIGITVHSWDNGNAALQAAAAMLGGLDKLAELVGKYPAQIGIEKLEFAPFPALKAPEPVKQAASTTPQASEKRNIDDVDSFLNGNEAKAQTPPNPVQNDLPFRFFKRLAPNVIQLQEFVQGGGGDKYQKSAIEATLPYDKKAKQYDEGTLFYLPITGEIQIKEGKFGKQGIIPTAKGKVYIDATDSKGQEKAEWATFAQDLYTHYERLNSDDNAKLFAAGAVLVMKAGKVDNGTQWKNYYRVYTELPKQS